MVRLQAKVVRATGATIHRHTSVVSGKLAHGTRIPTVASVEISESSNCFFLLYLDVDGKFLTDTWHPTLAEAMDQARFEFGIAETDWVSLDG